MLALTLAAVLLPAGPSAAASPPGLAAIPASYLTWYREAARTCKGLAWEVLAGIGTMESNNGRSDARGVHKGKNRMGAEGPMQFEPATFREYAVRADPAGKLTPYNPADAIFTAARMLCADGAAGGSPPGLQRAIFAYNHACWYVRDVLAIAGRYTVAARPRHPAAKHPSRRHRPRPRHQKQRHQKSNKNHKRRARHRPPPRHPRRGSQPGPAGFCTAHRQARGYGRSHGARTARGSPPGRRRL